MEIIVAEVIASQDTSGWKGHHEVSKSKWRQLCAQTGCPGLYPAYLESLQG